MRHLRWTYLHIGYYRPTITAWKNAGCYEEIQRDLGYRIGLKTASLPDQIKANQEFQVTLKMANTGYAPLYNYKNTSLVFKNTVSGLTHEVRLPVDLRECKPAAEFTIDQSVRAAGVPEGSYDLYLKIADKSESLKNRPEFSVRLANTGTWDEASGMNNLKHRVTITR
jgi:hypothetical protein